MLRDRFTCLLGTQVIEDSFNTAKHQLSLTGRAQVLPQKIWADAIDKRVLDGKHSFATPGRSSESHERQASLPRTLFHARPKAQAQSGRAV